METLLVVENEMNQRIRSVILLAFILLLGLGIRIFDLGNRPHGLIVDEAHFGYIAQSLLKTGQDEHGMPQPLLFTGFGDQKLPLQAYVLIPFVKLMGLNEWSVRLPSALAGSILIVVIYAWLKALDFKDSTALLGGLMVAVSPWSFILSRFAYESNLGLLLFATGLWSLAHALKRNKYRWWILSGLAFGSTWYAYIAYRLVTILFLGSSIIYLWTRHQKNWKQMVVWGLSFGVTILPFLLPSQLQSNTARLQQVGLFSDTGITLTVDENRNFCISQLPQPVCYAIWNKPTVIGRRIIDQYLEVISPEFLVTQGEQNLIYLSVENTGQFFGIVYPLFLLGLVTLFFGSIRSKPISDFHSLLMIGLLVTPLPAVLSGTIQKVRLSPAFPFMIATILIGWQQLLEKVKQPVWRKGIYLMVSLLFVAFGLLYTTRFLLIHTVKNDFYYDSYVADIMTFVQPYLSDHAVIIEPFFSDPILYFAYYTNQDPSYYQNQVVLGPKEASGFQHAVALGKVSQEQHGKSLETAACQAFQANQPTLYVTNENKGPAYLIKTIWSQNGALRYAYIYDAYAMGVDMAKGSRCH